MKSLPLLLIVASVACSCKPNELSDNETLGFTGPWRRENSSSSEASANVWFWRSGQYTLRMSYGARAAAGSPIVTDNFPKGGHEVFFEIHGRYTKNGSKVVLGPFVGEIKGDPESIELARKQFSKETGLAIKPEMSGPTRQRQLLDAVRIVDPRSDESFALVRDRNAGDGRGYFEDTTNWDTNISRKPGQTEGM